VAGINGHHFSGAGILAEIIERAAKKADQGAIFFIDMKLISIYQTHFMQKW
jgi:hypothetical protein